MTSSRARDYVARVGNHKNGYHQNNFLDRKTLDARRPNNNPNIEELLVICLYYLPNMIEGKSKVFI